MISAWIKRKYYFTVRDLFEVRILQTKYSNQQRLIETHNYIAISMSPWKAITVYIVPYYINDQGYGWVFNTAYTPRSIVQYKYIELHTIL